jgi:nucleoside-diphosphate-sugar epimerase
MRALILGGGGFIGARVAPALARLGHEGLIATRTGGGDRVAVNRNDPQVIAQVMRDNRCDTLIDMIAMEAPSTIALRDALAGSIARYVLISSADVYRNYGGLHRLEACTPILAPMTEDAPRRTRLYPYRTDPPRAPDAADARMDFYDKIPIEDALAGPGATIVRLPMVYGPGDRNSRFGWITAPMRRGAERIAAPAAWLDWRSTYGHADDIAHAIALCATHPTADGRIYHCGEMPIPHRAWVTRFAAQTGWTGEIVLEEDGPFASRLAALNPSFPLALDTSRIRRELGYAEILAPAEALQSVIDADAAR